MIPAAFPSVLKGVKNTTLLGNLAGVCALIACFLCVWERIKLCTVCLSSQKDRINKVPTTMALVMTAAQAECQEAVHKFPGIN